MRILGLSSFRHDTAAALLEDGRIVAAIEDAKLTRLQSRGVPDSAIQFCLQQAGITSRDLDAVALASRPLQGWARRSWGSVTNFPFSLASGAYFQGNELGNVARDLSGASLLRNRNGSSCQLLTFDHHACHGASAFYLSSFDRALILTFDADGDGRTGMVAIGEGTKLRVLETARFPHSLAWVYRQITELLGFRQEHKTQWLSLEGKPVFKEQFLNLLRRSGNALPRLNSRLLEHGVTGHLTLSRRFYAQVGVPENGAELPEDQRRDLASSLQHACTEVVGDLLEHYRKRENVESICLGGGLFQNVLLVSDLERRFGINQVFVPPAPGNAGCALGSALMVWHQEKNQPRAEAAPGNYWGPGFGRHEIKDILDNSKARYAVQSTSERKFDSAIQLLQAGKIVAWVQGRAEFGPRALGNRSLLASPWAPYVKENLNDFIKHREWFCPFAISVPEEDCDNYFESSTLCRTMNSLATLRPDADAVLREFCLPDGRIRLHRVERKSNPLYWSLLKRFGEESPAPILLNTSFNLAGEPLVARPQDAVRSYFCSGIDALLIENFLLSKTAAMHVLAGANVSTRAPLRVSS